MKKLFFLLLTVCSFALAVSAQTRTIKGQVVYAGDNEPLVGATILPVGGGQGVSTNIDGEFTLIIPEKVKLVTVSYVGMITQQVAVAPEMLIKMSNSDNQLDEVVVTAMGMKRERKSLGYAAQDLKSDDLNTDGTTSLASAIQGKLSGVDIRPSSGMPGASANIVIRGARSFEGNNTPLYVIDGMPVSSESDFTNNSVDGVAGYDGANRSIDINPDDIESMTVLKGQAAAALYGIRASNGVIVITTKRGAGLSSSRPVVTVSTNISAEVLSRKFKHQTEYSQGLDGEYNPSAGSYSWGRKISDLANSPDFGGNTDNEFTQKYGKHEGMYYNPNRVTAGADGWERPTVYDNMGDFFQTGITENSSFSISQKLDRCNYSFGLNNSYQKGIIPSTGMNRWNARGLVDWQLNDQWKTGFSANYVSSKINSAPWGNDSFMSVLYSAPAEYNLKGIPYHVPGDPSQQTSFRNSTFNNPYWWAANNECLQHTNRFYGNAYVEFRPKIEWGENYDLYFREQAGLDMYTNNNSDVREVGSGSAYTNGNIQNKGITRNIFNNLVTANFNAKLGNDKEWDLSVMLGTELNQDNYRRWYDYASDFNFYGLPTIGNAKSVTLAQDYEGGERNFGIFGNINLSWKNMLYLTLTGRNDWLSSMPPGHRSFFYPSVSLAWIFTELPYFKGNDIFTFGKLRTSFAEVGQAGGYQDDIFYTPYIGNGFYGNDPFNYPYNGVSGIVPYWIKYDPNLKPQNTQNFEIGADLRFFNDRLRVDYTYSYQDVKNQIFKVPLAGSTGYQYIYTNGGRITTNSHELNLFGSIVQTKDLTVDLGISFTTMKNFVKEIFGTMDNISLGGFTEPQIRAQIGSTYPIIYGTKFARDEEGNLLLDHDLKVPYTTGEAGNIGECTPNFEAGFNLNIRYKRVSISTTWSWKNGGKMYLGSKSVVDLFGASQATADARNAGKVIVTGVDDVTGEKGTFEVDPETYYYYATDVNEYSVYDADFLKLRDLTLSYNVPRFSIFDVTVFGFARNVLIWTKVPDFDPESSQGNNNMGGYFENYSLPQTMSFGGGFKVTF